MVKLIDTHSHLYAEEFSEDLDQVLINAKEAGVEKILLPNIERSTAGEMNRISREHPDMLIPMIGLHPCSVKEDTYKEELEFVHTEARKGGYIAIGEIGMDLYWDTTTENIQEIAFRDQCALANELGLPVAIHARESTRQLIDVIKDMALPNLTGVFHCFTGTEAEAKEIIELGFKLGIGGVLTFKNAGLDKTLSNIDLDHLILETDSPYLAPTPHRGKRNESAYTLLVAQKLAEVMGCTVEEIAEKTTSNAASLFKLKNLPL